MTIFHTTTNLEARIRASNYKNDDHVINTAVGASYIIDTNGTTIKAFNGSTLAVDYSGTNAATVIQNALNGLTSGRTWKETVIIKGNYSISSGITIPSYTKLVIDGQLKLANGIALSAMLKNKNAGTSLDSNIEIVGGIIDGNKAGGASGHGIQLDGVTDSIIHDITIQNVGGASGRGIYIVTTDATRITERIIISNVIVDGSTNSNIEVAGSTIDSTIIVRTVELTDIISSNSGARGIVFVDTQNSALTNFFAKNPTTHGVDLSYDSQDNTLSNLIIMSTGNNGITVDTLNSDRNKFTNFQIIQPTDNGIETSAKELVFSNFEIRSSGQHGMRIASSDRCIISNGVIKNNGQLAANTYHGIVLVGSDNCIIENIHAFDDQGTKTQRFGIVTDSNSDNNLVVGNNAVGNLLANGISIAGTGNVVRNNTGYTTEFTSTAIITSTQLSTNISHTLASTPIAVIITPAASEISGTNAPFIVSTWTTGFACKVATSTTADRTFYWLAQI